MKMKTKKTAAKRFKLSQAGHIMRSKQSLSHLRRNKSKRQLSRSNSTESVNKNYTRKIDVFLPYGGI